MKGIEAILVIVKSHVRDGALQAPAKRPVIFKSGQRLVTFDLEEPMKLRKKCHALAMGAGACGCGAGAHFLAHPCIGHAILAIVAWGLGVWAYFRAN